MISTRRQNIIKRKKEGTYVYSVEEEPDRKDRRSKPHAIRIPNSIPEIVPRAIFEKANIIMSSRTRTHREKHRCSGLVYCSECGAKMHYSHTERKGHEYNNFRCSAKCGAHSVPVETIDEAVDAYLTEMFNEKNISAVEKAIIDLDAENRLKAKEFLKQRDRSIKTLESELKNIIDALASGQFKGNYEYCNEMISQKRAAIEELKNTKPTKLDEKKIRTWMQNIIDSNYTPSVFIDRIEANTTEVKIISNFSSVVGNHGCGDSITSLPTTMDYFSFLNNR